MDMNERWDWPGTVFAMIIVIFILTMVSCANYGFYKEASGKLEGIECVRQEE